jgi:Uma2 family endonuclease
MSAVSFAEAWPGPSRPFTVEDLDLLPDDGHRCELLEGALVVSPRPGMPHQVVSTRLIVALSNACPQGLHVVAEPAVRLSADTEFVPDIAVVREDQIGGLKCTSPPLLVVEVRSPSTALIDLNRKKTAYERFGVPSYWIVVPDPASPELIAFELRDGHHTEAAQAAGTAVLRAAHPFPAEIVPAELVAGLPTA